MHFNSSTVSHHFVTSVGGNQQDVLVIAGVLGVFIRSIWHPFDSSGTGFVPIWLR